MIDPLPEKQREFLAVMGLADEFTVEMAQFVMADAHAEDLLAALTGRMRLSSVCRTARPTGSTT